MCALEGEGLSLSPTLAGWPWLPHLWSREQCRPCIIIKEIKGEKVQRRNVREISSAQCFAFRRRTVSVALKIECCSVLRSAFCILQVGSCQFMGWDCPRKETELRAVSSASVTSCLWAAATPMFPHSDPTGQFWLLYLPLRCFPLCQDQTSATVYNELIVQDQVYLQKDVLSSIYSAGTYLRMVLCFQR